MIPAQQVEVKLAHSQALGFLALFQRGVPVVATTGCSLWSFLTEQLGIPPDYVKERVTTIFLDGDVIDSLEGATLREGSVLALSAAMPGLVGATMRRGGYYAAMRSAITHGIESAPPAAAGGLGTIRVKLFNLLIPELGPALLAHGIVLERREAAEALPADALRDLPAVGPVLLRARFVDDPPDRARR